MTVRWEDLNARARGLSTHLLSRAELDSFARLPDAFSLGAALRARGFPVEEGEGSFAALELASRRSAAQHLQTMARWCGPRAATLAVVFEDEDRRSLRALLRGSVQAAPSEARIAGLIPTPSLPERALETLAEQASPAAIAALLVAWRNPYGSPLLVVASESHPDLFKLELLVSRTFAARALKAARGTPALQAYVGETIDIENAYTALVLAGEGKDVTFKDAFLSGGQRISITDFEAAAATGDAARAGRRLAEAFAGAPIATEFTRWSGDPVQLEGAVLRVRIRALVQARRLRPLGPAPLLLYALRLRAESVDLQRVVWGIAFGAPSSTLAEELVTD